MATITERTAKDGTKRYRAEVRLKGCPTQTATFKRKTDASKWIQNTESAIREGRHFKTVEAKKHTFADLADRYIKAELPNYNEKEQAERKSKLTWWKDKIGVYLLADITPPLIVECRESLGESRAPATVVRYMAALSHAFTVAVNEWQWVHDNPVKKVKKPTEPDGRVRFLDDDERAKLLTACKESSNDWLYLCVILALSSGMRQAELMGLKWQDVNLKDGFLILHKTKNGTRRRVPLAGHGLELLREHSKIRRLDTDLLFPSKNNPQKPINLRSAFEYALERADINDLKWHDLRHCTASYLAMNGASLAEIAEVLGHKTLNMVKRYAHLSDGHVSNVVASMNQKIFGGV
ncbi:tyrosine-type recombinase/integrase [Methylovulum miyakonense]|uniref:tyrosine-type recombinase/integrase n=1 Tax=Methylovulum miyakonense TaxID=645578 RepID=UPI00048D3754|nr:site-specific integrase [Methylovulum miyakonense]